MSGTSLLLIVANVFLTAIGQVLLKAGVMKHPVQAAISEDNWAAVLPAFASQPLVLAGLAAYGIAVVIWLLVLARVSLSTAYPFVALSIALTTLLGAFTFGETFTLPKLAGTAVIMAGVILLARG